MCPVISCDWWFNRIVFICPIDEDLHRRTTAEDTALDPDHDPTPHVCMTPDKWATRMISAFPQEVGDSLHLFYLTSEDLESAVGKAFMLL